MKKKSLYLLLALPSLGYAQGLFDIAPNDEAQESSSKINWNAGLSFGYDGNINPGSGNKPIGSSFLSTHIGANSVKVSEKTSIELYGHYQLNYYFKDVQGNSNKNHNVNGGLNLSHQFTDRLRFSSRNHIGYELEPNYNYGFANTRASEEYFYWSSDQSFGYRWTERFATYTGISFSGTKSGDDDDSNSDTYNIAPYIQGRYQLNKKNVLTASYRYSKSNNDNGRDSLSHILTGGIERRLSETTVFVGRAGVQFRDIDGGENSSSPYLEAALRSRWSERTKIRSFVRYGVSDFDSSFGETRYDKNQNLRFGLSAKHQATEKLAFTGDANYIYSSYEDGSNGASDEDVHLFNASLGASYKLVRNFYITTNINQTIGSSNLVSRDYNRSRYNLGVNYRW